MQPLDTSALNLLGLSSISSPSSINEAAQTFDTLSRALPEMAVLPPSFGIDEAAQNPDSMSYTSHKNEAALSHDILPQEVATTNVSSYTYKEIEAKNVDNISPAISNSDIDFHLPSKAEAAATKRLEILCLELPDPDLLLFEQRLGSFTCFPDLPIELRTIIWRFSFPRGRKVHVKNPENNRLNTRDNPNTLSFKSRHQAPSTFRVNCESRTVSLKYYRVLLQNIHDTRRRIYFHPGLDTIFLPDVYPVEQGHLFLRMSPKLCATFGQIQSLQMHHMWWSRYRTAALGPIGDNMMDRELFEGFTVKDIRNVFYPGHFKNLHELHLIATQCHNTFLSTADGIAQCTASILHLFTTKAKVDTDVMIPKITITAAENI